MAELIGLTGKSGAGKTKVCQDIIHVAYSAGLSVFGFYCPGVFNGEEKTGIEVRLLPGEETYLLGSLEKEQKNWQPIGRWWMNPNIFELVNKHLKTFASSDVLLIDEIGPAEIEGHQGWYGAMNVLKENHFQVGIVSFRPAFIHFFKNNYPRIQVIDLDKCNQSDLQDLMMQFCKLSPGA